MVTNTGAAGGEGGAASLKPRVNFVCAQFDKPQDLTAIDVPLSKHQLS